MASIPEFQLLIFAAFAMSWVTPIQDLQVPK